MLPPKPTRPKQFNSKQNNIYQVTSMSTTRQENVLKFRQMINLVIRLSVMNPNGRTLELMNINFF